MPGLSARTEGAAVRPLVLPAVPAGGDQRSETQTEHSLAFRRPGVPQLSSCHEPGARPSGDRPAYQLQLETIGGDCLGRREESYPEGKPESLASCIHA